MSNAINFQMAIEYLHLHIPPIGHFLESTLNEIGVDQKGISDYYKEKIATFDMQDISFHSVIKQIVQLFFDKF